MAQKVVLAGACRTAIGKMGGALSNTPARRFRRNRNQRSIKQSWC